jgi:hypothetical protein
MSLHLYICHHFRELVSTLSYEKDSKPCSAGGGNLYALSLEKVLP